MPSAEGPFPDAPISRPDALILESAAREFGTPLYLYYEEVMRGRFERVRRAFQDLDSLICFSVKACSNLTVLARLASWGSGFDIVSGGELERVLRAGGEMERVFFAGVGKQDWEIDLALERGVARFNAESAFELERIAHRASKRGLCARVALRVNPDVDAATHRYITTGKRENKFGVNLREAAQVIRRAGTLEGIRLSGLHCHIGSQICDFQPYRLALSRLRELVEECGVERFDHLDLGGGFGIDYGAGNALDIESLAAILLPDLRALGLQTILEPGRFIAAPAGVLLTRVIEVKRSAERSFVIVDAGMNDLLRPSLYQARHRIEPVIAADRGRSVVQVVGPICESADFLGRDLLMPLPDPGDLLIVRDAGAYGFSMSSQYNSRPRAAEVLVDAQGLHLIRRRETLDDLMRLETQPGCG